MAIYSENFQSYPVGTTSPYGALTGAGAISNSPTPDGLIGPYGETRYLAITAGSVVFDDSTARTTGSIFWAMMFPTSLFSDQMVTLQSGRSGGGFPSIIVRVNGDGTVSLADAHNVTFATSLTAIRLNTWYYCQLNVTFTVDGSGHYVVAYSLTIDGDEILSGSWASGIGLSPVWASTVWGTLPAIGFSNLAIDVLQTPGYVENPGTPVARVTQQVIELIGAAAPLAGTCPTAGIATVGVPYDGFIVASGGTAPYTFAVTGGSLPPGLSLNTSTGEITGTPTTPGTFPYQITITDSATPTPNTTIISCTAPIVTTGGISGSCPVPNVIPALVPYSAAVGIIGGTPPYTVTLTGGSLPPGLSIVGTNIVGTPTTPGMYPYTLLVTDSSTPTPLSFPLSCQITVAVSPACNQSLL